MASFENSRLLRCTETGISDSSFTGWCRKLLSSAVCVETHFQSIFVDVNLAVSSSCIQLRLCCVRLQDLEPTTNGPPITRTVAGFIQAPAQDPLVCSSTRQCWLQLCGCRVASSHRRCCDCTVSSAPTQRWTWVHFSSPNPTQPINLRTQPKPPIIHLREMQPPVL